MLEEKDIMFERNEKEELIAHEVTLDLLSDKPIVLIIPIPRGTLQELFSKAKNGTHEEKIKADNEIILSGLIKPKMTEEKLKFMKPTYAKAISIAILAASLDITQKEMNEKAEKAEEYMMGDFDKKKR